MSRKPKAFQKQTIGHVTAVLHEGSARRFLVADEAGLGKTMVARGVIQNLADLKPSRLTVFYVCSSQPIASQNADSLLSFLDNDSEIAKARAKADRPSLLPLSELPSHREVRLFTLTPMTMYSGGRRGLQRGHALERALACAFLHHLVGKPLQRVQNHLAMGVGGFGDMVRRYRADLKAKVADSDVDTKRFLKAFRLELMMALKASRGRLWEALESLRQERPVVMASIVRNVMAAAVLRALKPDLVIFDEFQRFRELMTRGDGDLSKDLRMQGSQRRIIDVVLARDESVKLLMLSATPYEALTAGVGARHRHEDGDSDFFRIVDFLFEHHNQGASHRRKIREQFSLMEAELRKGAYRSAELVQAREELRRMLLKVMCRTERPPQKRHDLQIEAPALLPSDLKAFGELATCMDNDVQSWAVPLWASVPAPIQTLGSKYKCWNNTSFKGTQPVIKRKQVDDGVIPRNWPHPKLRGMLEALPPKTLALPWIRPSLEWWRIRGPWAAANTSKLDGKLLVFSRFAATPGAVSGLVSYEVETRMLGSRPTGKTYESVGKASHFKVKADAPALFTLFFASSFLALIDPLASGFPRTVSAAKNAIRRQLRARINAEVSNKVKRPLMKPHVLLIALEKRQQTWPAARDAWVKALAASGSVSKAAALSAVRDWENKAKPDFTALAQSEFDLLVDLALDLPGVVVERALTRHWPGARNQRETIQMLLVNGFRRYFDKPWFASSLAGNGSGAATDSSRRAKDYPSDLRAAVVAGNLESVLDEHFWTMSNSGKSWDEGIEELTDALNVSGGRARLRERGKGTLRIDLRCHVAMPLHPAKSDADSLPGERPARPDQVRHAFNSPFWPHVVSTTSVGQEGLDFHIWCRSVCHWDPARGPVELEQREGRVARFSGLSIRLALAQQATLDQREKGESPWKAVARWATGLEDSHTQMTPWWCVDQAITVQCNFAPAGSREHQQGAMLERARALYRMVLGATNPGPLLEELEADDNVTPDLAATAAINLRPQPLDT
jgi:hypothetical protein